MVSLVSLVSLAPSPVWSAASALNLVAKAVKDLEKAEKKGKGVLVFGASPGDLARASRQAARERLDTVVTGADPRIVRKLAAAEKQFAKGDMNLANRLHGAATKRYRKAYKKAEKIP